MIPVERVYQNVQDRVPPHENGNLSMDMFSRFSRLSELKMLDFLTGDIEGDKPPETYVTRKLKDYVSFLIEPVDRNISDGRTQKPDNYYKYEALYLYGSNRDGEPCGETFKPSGRNTPIEVLESEQFDARASTYIRSLVPSISKPIAKIVGNEFIFLPKELGTICMEYIRYPKYAKLVGKIDPIYKTIVPDTANSDDYEWPEYSEELLTWFIVDMFANNTQSQAAKVFNQQTGKLVRDGK